MNSIKSGSKRIFSCSKSGRASSLGRQIRFKRLRIKYLRLQERERELISLNSNSYRPSKRDFFLLYFLKLRLIKISFYHQNKATNSFITLLINFSLNMWYFKRWWKGWLWKKKQSWKNFLFVLIRLKYVGKVRDIIKT